MKNKSSNDSTSQIAHFGVVTTFHKTLLMEKLLFESTRLLYTFRENWNEFIKKGSIKNENWEEKTC